MGNPLRDRRTPSDWAVSGQVIDFSEKLGEFKNLADMVADDLAALAAAKLPADWRDAVVVGQLRFSCDAAQNGLPRLEGRVAATIETVCQRCLEVFELPIALDLRLLFANGESDIAAAHEYEFWELEDDKLRPLDLVEEALIMAIPLVAKHTDSETCHESDLEEQESGDRIRPFAALKAQMEKKD